MAFWAVRATGFGGGVDLFDVQREAVEHYARHLTGTSDAELFRVLASGSLEDYETHQRLQRAVDSLPWGLAPGTTLTPAEGIAVQRLVGKGD